MPTPPSRLRLLLAGVLAVGLTVGLAVLLVPATAITGPLAVAHAAESSPPAPPPQASASAAPTPTCQPQPLCGVNPGPSEEPTPTAPPSETPSESASPSATPTPTASPTPRRTRSRSAAPVVRDEQPADEGGGSLADPVTGGGTLGTLSPGTAAPLATPSTEEAASGSRGGDGLTRLLFLVLAVGVFLGLAGGTGLYVTRHTHEH